MPHYELEVHEDGGEITGGAHEYDEEDPYELGDLFEHDGRVLRVFQIALGAQYVQRLLCDVSNWEALETQRAARAAKTREVAPDAAAQIASNGGKLYLWQEPFGKAWLRDKASFERPPGIPFETFEDAGIQLLIASDIELPERLSIKCSIKHPLRLEIDWDGAAWGDRGYRELHWL